MFFFLFGYSALFSLASLSTESFKCKYSSEFTPWLLFLTLHTSLICHFIPIAQMPFLFFAYVFYSHISSPNFFPEFRTVCPIIYWTSPLRCPIDKIQNYHHLSSSLPCKPLYSVLPAVFLILLNGTNCVREKNVGIISSLSFYPLPNPCPVDSSKYF